MDKELLKDVLRSQVVSTKSEVVPRTVLPKIQELSETPFIIILSGVRRCGKSTVLQEVRDDHCYYVNFDDERLINFTVADFQLMEEILVELFGEKRTYIFDEIQNISGWERFVRRLHDNKRKVYLSGSNASMLSRELGTHLTGRNIQLTMFPFSFTEYLEFRGLSKSAKKKQENLENSQLSERALMKRVYTEYVLDGGFPEYLKTKKTEYLHALYENIIYRDIITRYKLTGEKAIKETVYYIASNVGKELSFNTLRRLTGLTSATTIKEYLQYLENSFLAFLLPKYSPSLKKQMYSPKKVYLIDTCLASLLGFRSSGDRGRLMENIVFLSLRRLSNELYFHREVGECDFLVRTAGRITRAVQVTVSLTDDNRKRETRGLYEAMKEHSLSEGYIITEDQSEELIVERKKIHVLPIWKWLLENEK